MEFDSGRFFVLPCAYTGKEVVECKVLTVIVVAFQDQVRWLRLRAVALSGVPADPWSGRAGTFSRKRFRELGRNLPPHVVGTGVSEGPHVPRETAQAGFPLDPVE